MFAVRLTVPFLAWVAALAQPLHRRLAWRLFDVVAGILLAQGRRTAASWWRAAGIGPRCRSYYYFLDSLGHKVAEVAAVLLELVLDRIEPEDRLLLAIDDPPTKRYGPKVPGAGIHPNPTPGPAGSKFLYGHSWVVLNQVVHHDRHGTIGLPLRADLYVRQKDVPHLPAQAGCQFRTELELAAEQIAWAGRLVRDRAQRLGVAVDGSYGNREFIKPAKRAGFVVGARLRKDATLFDLPQPLPPGQRRGRGRPPIYGKHRISLAKRAGQTRGWRTVEVVTTAGRTVTKTVKTFLATWKPAGGVVRVVIVKEDDGSWRAYRCTDPEASVEAIVQAALDRWSIEQNFHDLKEVEGIEQVQLRRLGSNGGALHLSLWVHTLVELWAWDRPSESLCDRSASPWDDASRRPSHADRRRALQREMWEEEFERTCGLGALPQKIQQLYQCVIRLVA